MKKKENKFSITLFHILMYSEVMSSNLRNKLCANLKEKKKQHMYIYEYLAPLFA